MDFAEIIEEVKCKKEYFRELLVSFVLTDTLLYITDNLAKQDCGKNVYNAVCLANSILNTKYECCNGIIVLSANESQQAKLRKYLDEISLEKFCVVYVVATELRSVLLGILFAEQKIKIEEAFDLAFFEEIYEQNNWGCLDEITKNHNEIKNKLKCIEGFCFERAIYKN